MLGLKGRFIKLQLKDYVNKWRSRARQTKDKDLHNKLYKSLLNTTLNKLKYRLLANRFNQWRKKPDLDLDALFNKFKRFSNAVKDYAHSQLKPTKKEFIEKLNKTKHPKLFKKAGHKLLDQYLNKDKNILRYFFYKWRDQCRNLEIYDLKLQLLKFLAGTNDNRNRRSRLSNAMNKWKTKVTHINRNENEDKLRRINNGLSKLEKRLNGRQMDFMVRLFRKMNKDYRPNILRTLAKKLDKPRGTVRDCLNKWRRVNDIEKNNDNVKDLRKRLANTKAYNMRKNKTRDALLKSFFKWKNMARNPEDYYPKITNLLDKLTKNIKQKQLKEPFDKIKQARNYTRKGLSLLKNYKKLTDRYNKDH
jgi:hypothetical protein